MQSVELYQFLEEGGGVLWAIFLLNIFLWSLIFDRLWYFFILHPKSVKSTQKSWLARTDKTSWYALRVRNMLVAKMHDKLKKNLILIKVSVELLPVLGLLGTVVGMIHAFEILTLFGNGNARALGSSISQAMITTLAGLLGAIPGFFMISILQKKTAEEKDRLMEQLQIVKA